MSSPGEKFLDVWKRAPRLLVANKVV